VELPVRYGGKFGPDLEETSARLGLSVGELVDRHVSAEYVVGFMGFTPGFAYMSGLPTSLSVPRLEHPRQRLAAGSVGIAAGQCGLYALDGPGGWPIIARVMMRLFDTEAPQPFLLEAGTRVTFRRVES
ncbi:UNVERIFIED_CONTAM: hypothetical protein GTU68_000505, partial [Idotea baltica]|nr:hypothetical protein [Idotea baltica]